MKTIGVLALQGAFGKHIEMLKKLPVHTVEVRKPVDLDKCDALIIPGGESTTIFRQMLFIELRDKIQEFAQDKPLFGTCAGLILMAKEIMAGDMQPFGFLDITVERNAFGRQADSFIADVDVTIGPKKKLVYPAFFIRAPRIRQCNHKVQVLASYQEEPIFVQQGMHLGATFHPELTKDPAIHEYFVSLA